MTHERTWRCLNHGTFKPLCRICKRHVGEADRMGRVLANKRAGSHHWAALAGSGNGFALWLGGHCRRRGFMQRRAKTCA